LAAFELILHGFLMFLSEGKLLNESDLTIICAYTLKVEDGITNTTFALLSLKPHSTQSSLQRNGCSFSQVLSLHATVVALPHVSVILAHTRPCCSA